MRGVLIPVTKMINNASRLGSSSLQSPQAGEFLLWGNFLLHQMFLGNLLELVDDVFLDLLCVLLIVDLLLEFMEKPVAFSSLLS